MTYSANFNALKKAFSSFQNGVEVGNVKIQELDFYSKAHDILPGVTDYCCKKHNQSFKSDFSFYTEIGRLGHKVHIKDIFVNENQEFNYRFLMPKGEKKSNKVILLFHGFNEKDWDKYLPWAHAICEGTGRMVILFPIAFHMQRAPKHWSDKREMFKLSKSRIERFPNIVHSTLSNVAISMRLHSMPQRFIWSGLQTYYDVIQFMDDCKQGNHPFIDKNADFDIFAYSIGGFLAQILKLTNHNDYFTDSKVCLFCSGATFNRLSPVSKFILDSEANVALYSFLVEHFDKMLEKDNLLHHYIKEDHPEGEIFNAMLDFQKMRDLREGLLKKYEQYFYAITLKKDKIIPSFEVINTLQGAYRDIHIAVDEIDFDRNYTHENPFPANLSKAEDEKQIDSDYRTVFDKVCTFFNS
jgi:hypothetical protein